MKLRRGKNRNNRVNVKVEIPCPHVPDGIVIQILSKLPVKSLLRCRCVSKSWLSMISDPKFKLAAQRKQVIVTSRRWLLLPFVNQLRFSIDLIDDELSVEELPIPKPLRQDSFPDGPRLWGSYNGLLLVSSGKNLFLWNPLTRWCNKVLSHCRLYNCRYGRSIVSALYYDSLTDDGCVMVGSLRNKTWTEIRFPYNMENLRPGPAVNDRVHWLVCQHSQVEPYLIVSFNLQTNEFVEVPMPHHEQSKGTIVLGFGVFDGCLSLLFSNDNGRPDATEILVLAMTKYGDKASWTYLFEISNSLPFEPTLDFTMPWCSTAYGELLIMHWNADQWGIFSCNPEHNWHRDFQIPRIPSMCSGCMFVGSLVSPRSYNWDEEENTKFCILGVTWMGVTWKRKFIRLVFLIFFVFTMVLLLQTRVLCLP